MLSETTFFPEGGDTPHVDSNLPDFLHEQLPEVPVGNILREPCRRNTAPCIAYVSWRIKNADVNANIVLFS